jgi:uncharacterized protein YjbI with pentapeptide repeats
MGSSIIDIFKEVITSFTEIIDNKEIDKALAQANGLISVVGIGINVYKIIRDKNRSPGETALTSLLNFIAETIDDSLKELKTTIGDNEIKLTITEEKRLSKEEKKKLLHDLLVNPFETNSDWKHYMVSDWNSNILNEHPVVVKFRTCIATHLEQNYNKQIARTFENIFNSRLSGNATDNQNIKHFRKWWIIQLRPTEEQKYLKFVEDKKNFATDLDNKNLNEYYISQNGVLVDYNKTWNLDDDKIPKYLKSLQNKKSSNYAQNLGSIDDIRKIIDRFLKSNDNTSFYLIIGGSFGIGKTAMARMIASYYATDNLYRDYNNEGRTRRKVPKYIPIVADLKQGFNNVYHDESLKSLLQRIAPVNNSEEMYKRILVILDGLDEYDGAKLNADNGDLQTYHREYPNMKFIIITNLKYGLLSRHQLNAGNYIRLLPFTKKQVNKFFKKYGTGLTYNYCQKLGLQQEITRPLFAWIISFVIANSIQVHEIPNIMKELVKGWTVDMIKSFVYMLFFHYTLRGKNSEKREERYSKEKKALRRVAALKQVYNEYLTEQHVKSELINFVDSEIVDSLTKLYFYVNDNKINFKHESFKYYLLAESYIQNILEDKVYRLNTGKPTRDTILFLKGLIELLRTEHENIKKFVEWSEKEEHYSSLLNSFEYREGLFHARQRIKNITAECINSEQIIFVQQEDYSNDDIKKENIWRKESMSIYENLLLHKWISLYIISTLFEGRKENLVRKESLIQTLKYSSDLIPSYLKNLNGANLSGNIEDLSHTDLSRVNLSYANMSQAVLTCTTLKRADLSYADLSYADLSSSSDAFYTDLVGANLFQTNLSYVNLSHADLTRANLIHANLSAADLSYVNLTRANLSNSIIVGCTKYDKLKCEWTEFNDAVIDNIGLINYLEKNKASKVPSPIMDKVKLKERLVGRIKKDDIEALLKISVLP